MLKERDLNPPQKLINYLLYSKSKQFPLYDFEELEEKEFEEIGDFLISTQEKSTFDKIWQDLIHGKKNSK